jgi:crotonobetainyl-CoA:carnitine CoA-transferase CaiB-like acyl-CoA transferase
MDRMCEGLNVVELRALNPALVHCSITGFGRTGPGLPARSTSSSR